MPFCRSFSSYIHWAPLYPVHYYSICWDSECSFFSQLCFSGTQQTISDVYFSNGGDLNVRIATWCSLEIFYVLIIDLSHRTLYVRFKGTVICDLMLPIMAGFWCVRRSNIELACGICSSWRRGWKPCWHISRPVLVPGSSEHAVVSVGCALAARAQSGYLPGAFAAQGYLWGSIVSPRASVSVGSDSVVATYQPYSSAYSSV